MAEFIRNLQELRQLPPQLHLLCPRQTDNDTGHYDETTYANETTKPDPDEVVRFRDVELRRKKFVSSLQLLAYDGKESEQYQRYIWERLEDALGKCELCIREYYIAKLDLLAELREEYEEGEVDAFFDIINRRDVKRITDGLNKAAEKLESLPDQKRTLKSVDQTVLFPIFEALSCETFLKDENKLQEFFDKPFALIQTKNPLKTQEYMPAATHFLFDSKKIRSDWARYTWSRIVRPPTEVEWNWTVKDTLQRQLQAATLPSNLKALWSALACIVQKLDEKTIKYRLCDIVPNVCSTALEHLSRKDAGLLSLLQTVKLIFEKAPDAFWEAMGSISASAVAEQIFGSPDLNKYLQESHSRSENSSLVLSWIGPFLMSLKPANRPPVCQTLAAQLFQKARQTSLNEKSRLQCYDLAMDVFLQTLKSFTDNEVTRQSVSRVVLADTLDTISHHIDDVLAPAHFGAQGEQRVALRSKALDIVRNSLALDCQGLKMDFDVLSKNQSLEHGSSSYSPDIWEAVIKYLADDDVDLSTAALLGSLSLPGLEPLITRDNQSPEKRKYNLIFQKITGLFGQILEKLADFEPAHLDELYKSPHTSMPLVSALCSADERTFQAAGQLVKNISGQSAKKEAMAHLLNAFFGTTILGLCWTLRRLSTMRTFGSVPRMLKLGMDNVDILSDSHTGVLRTMRLDPRDQSALLKFWGYQWQEMKVVFAETEKWSLQIHDKPLMTEVCRDAMQYAEALFEQYDVIASSLIKARPERAPEIPKTLLQSSEGSPGILLDAMVKWLRLRDEYLVDVCVKLVSKLLCRLGDHEILISPDGLDYIKEIAIKGTVKTMLLGSQKAELVRSLEAYYRKPIGAMTLASKKQSSLKNWVGSRLDKDDETPASSRVQSSDDFGDSEITDSDFSKATEAQQAQLVAKHKVLKDGLSTVKSATRSALLLTKPVKPTVKKQEDVNAFLVNRRREQAAAEARKREAALLLKGRTGVGAQTKGQGSGIQGIGVKGKDHSTAQDSMMVSSESESDSEDELDRQLFGSKVRAVQKPVHANGVRVPAQSGPVKKVKVARSQKDMRARLAPDLSNLHKTILGWDFFADGDLPPDSVKDDYTLVSNTFKTVAEYQKTFEPLLILEGWQSFRSARETSTRDEGSFKPFEIKVVNRLSVDNFVEISTTMTLADGKELGIGTADVILLSKSNRPHQDPESPHCLARVKEIGKKKGIFEIVYRVIAGSNVLLPSLAPDSPLWGVQIISLTPLEREFGALMALPYYDLWEEIVKAKPSPLLEYADQVLHPFVEVYEVNMAQAKAVKSALDNDAFTLIQGPPGSGKTKTICALIGAMLTGSLQHQKSGLKRSSISPFKKVLVCAPSNAAVDELVMRFKKGVKTMNGSTEQLSVVRLGRSDAINTNVKDVALEELVNARLSLAAPKPSNDIDIKDIMDLHKATSNTLHELRRTIEATRSQGKPVTPEQVTEFDGLKRKRAQLSQQIDNLRDQQKIAFRDTELNRKRIQQEILDSAHVLCATLSGSGHEIFQGLNIEFETVIIDEAAQSIELSALIPLKYGCSKCILVGDPKQLPPTVLSREAAKFQYEQSLFARMEKNHQKDIHLLDTQYRMHPEISIYPSKTFYGGRLKDGEGMAQLRLRKWHHSSLLAPYRFFDVQGMQQSAGKGHSLVNVAEVNVALQLYDRLVTDVHTYDFRGKIGIITPYKGQLKELKRRFSQRYGQEILSVIEFNTTDAFQGRESEIIIFSCVRASTTGIGFLNDVRRMNVGLTRAKCSLWVLGNSEALIQGEFWRGMVNDAKTRNLYTSGDILAMLRRPLLTEDMMRDDVEMEDMDATRNGSTRNNSIVSDTGKTSESEAPSVVIPPANKAKDASTSDQAALNNLSSRQKVSQSSSTSEAVRNRLAEAAKQVKPADRAAAARAGPSGGRAGLNPRAMCNICGSNSHFSHACDNDAARLASLGGCLRCKKPGHTMRSCNAPRCIDCGEVGHTTQECQAAPQQRLTGAEKDRVRQQEVDFGREKDRAREKRAQKQLGEHAAPIPVVRSTLTSTGNARAATSGRDQSSAQPEPDMKRKRSDMDFAGVPKGPKALGMSNEGADAGHRNGTRASGDEVAIISQTPRNEPAAPASGMRASGTPVVLKRKKPKDDDMFMKKKKR